MKDKIIALFATHISSLYDLELSVELLNPDEKFGDFSTNVALKIAKQINKNPSDIASAIVEDIKSQLPDYISEVSVAGPGFINIKLSDQALVSTAEQDPDKSLKGKVIVAEYSDPNPFKTLHAGHLYTSIVGNCIANLVENAGATVHRVNFGGDVGLHVAKNIWAVIQHIGSEDPSKLESVDPSTRADWLSERYVEGNTAYEVDDDNAKLEIQNINKRIYEISLSGDHDSPLAQIYWTCRDWSYAYFNDFYARLNISFEKYYPESETIEEGLNIVRANIPDVYEESEGAIVFKGEKYGLYTNVFINSVGLPTYSAKDVGLLFKKWQDYNFDKSLIITSSDQLDYMRVVFKSIEMFRPDLAKASVHLSHGVVKLSGGQKMSSRLGNILKASDVLDATGKANKESNNDTNEDITIGAVKYAFLKQRLGGDIVYDPAESVSLEGNSGPYLQYAYARAKSILSKAGDSDPDVKLGDVNDFTDFERSLVKKLSDYADTINLAVTELKPHYICTYLYELAQVFNRFYENSRVIDDPRQGIRLSLINLYAKRLSQGLGLIGVSAPEHM